MLNWLYDSQQAISGLIELRSRRIRKILVRLISGYIYVTFTFIV